MKSIRFLFFVIGLFALWGGVMPDALAADTSAVKMTLSANENYLRRFRKEREALASATDADSVKKRQALEAKIKNLEVETQRLAAVLEKNTAKKTAQAVSAPAPSPASSAASATAAPAPVAPVASEAIVQPASKPEAPAPSGSSSHPAGTAVAEWEKMNREEKEAYVLKVVNDLKKDGHPVERHPLFYTALMDYVFVSDAALAARPLKDAVIATIRKNETSFSAI